jgi:polyisoprenoid-binding protein YceI
MKSLRNSFNGKFTDKLKMLSFAVVMVFCRGNPVQAEIYHLKLNPETTKISFVLQATMHQVHGVIPLASGEISFDTADKKISGTMLMNTSAVTTNHPGRDKKVHQEVLESEKYPSIVFHLERYEGDLSLKDKSSLKLFGNIDIHGSNHPLEIPLSLELSADPANTALLNIHGSSNFDIPYVAWGIKDPSVFVMRVGKKVAVKLELSGQLSRT